MAVVKGSPVRRKETSALPSSPRLDALAELEGQKAIAAVKAGLDASLVRQLAMRLDLTLEDLAVPLHLTSRTLHRRLEHGRLSLDESERLLSLAKIFALAKATLGSESKAVHWMKSPVPALGSKTPLECAETQIGLREVEDVLVRIEDVVYS